MSAPAAVAAKQEATHFTQTVGKIRPIELPVRELGEFLGTLGEKIAQGDYGTIYEMRGHPERLYKVIFLEKFESGDEIRISEIAAQVGVSPAFHGAFLSTQGEKQFVVIEIDHGGKTMGQWMEDLAELAPEAVADTEAQEDPLSPKMRAFLEKLRANDPFQVTAIEKKLRIGLDEAIDQMYEKPEDFYFEFFSKLKVLAENHIAYGDSHVGNILPTPVMQLIDFDGASIEASVEAAARKTMESAYTIHHFRNFQKIEGLSTDARILMEWFLA